MVACKYSSYHTGFFFPLLVDGISFVIFFSSFPLWFGTAQNRCYLSVFMCFSYVFSEHFEILFDLQLILAQGKRSESSVSLLPADIWFSQCCSFSKLSFSKNNCWNENPSFIIHLYSFGNRFSTLIFIYVWCFLSTCVCVCPCARVWGGVKWIGFTYFLFFPYCFSVVHFINFVIFIEEILILYKYVIRMCINVNGLNLDN